MSTTVENAVLLDSTHCILRGLYIVLLSHRPACLARLALYYVSFKSRILVEANYILKDEPRASHIAH